MNNQTMYLTSHVLWSLNTNTDNVTSV